MNVPGYSQDLVIPVTNFHNEDKGFMVLAGDVFDVPIRKDIVHRVVRWQLAKRQQVLLEYSKSILYCKYGTKTKFDCQEMLSALPIHYKLIDGLQ